ncbi:MAG TPA: histidine kinase [Ruminiclostridium sp.]|nr:histidine kinase [Ruminiclostridium sp.]
MITTSLMAATSLYTYYNAKILMNKMDTLFVSNISMNELQDTVTRVHQNLENYLDTKHSDSLRNFIGTRDALQALSKNLIDEADYSANGLLLRDISNMINNYIKSADNAVQSKRARDINRYTAYYNDANRIMGYIDVYISKLNNELLKQNTARYTSIAGRINLIHMINITVIAGVVLFNIIFILLVTYRTTKPIMRLAQTADEISKGNFDVPEVDVDTEDEISVMANAFNKMTCSIREHIDDLKENAQLQSRLKEQEMQNLIMKNHLKDAELHALQSQINPHFIFNTLNTGAQIAMMEGADKTCYFIENVANLFRYNLKKLDIPVTLGEEINNINTYIYILKTRFTDRIEFIQEVEEDLLGIQIPCMVLQPIVENAYIHGIGNLESGGRIILRVKGYESYAELTVIDNGKGMDQTKARQLLGETEAADPRLLSDSKKGHTTGIGMANVISRLNIFYGRDNIVDILSEPGKGTSVFIRIPVDIKESIHV